MVDGKLYDNDDQPLHMLALLLENVGIDAAIRLGDPGVWREAVAELERHFVVVAQEMPEFFAFCWALPQVGPFGTWT